METDTITGQGVIDAAAILFSGIEHPEVREGDRAARRRRAAARTGR